MNPSTAEGDALSARREGRPKVNNKTVVENGPKEFKKNIDAALDDLLDSCGFDVESNSSESDEPKKAVKAELGRVGKSRKAKARYQAGIKVTIGGVEMDALLDSGNNFKTVMSLAAFEKAGFSRRRLAPVSGHMQVVTAEADRQLKILGQFQTPIKVQLGQSGQELYVRPVVIPGMGTSLNISGPTLYENGIDLLTSRNCIMMRGRIIPLDPSPSEDPQGTRVRVVQKAVKLHQKVVVPANSMKYARCHVGSDFPWDAKNSHFVSTLDAESPLLTPLEALIQVDDHGRFWLPLLNATGEAQTLSAGRRLGNLGAHEEEPHVQEVRVPTDPAPQNREEKMEWLRKNLKLSQSSWIQNDSKLKEMTEEVLLKYYDLFNGPTKFGSTDILEHEIITEDVPPIKMRSRPMNPHYAADLRRQLDEWLEEGIIAPSNSPWSFPCVPVKKKNSTKFRWCIDYRKLNDITKKDSYPLPSIADNLARLGRSKVFSTLDGRGAYHVVRVAEKDREKTAFSTPFGLFEFIRMSFGLANAPSTYSRLVAKVLEHLPPEMVAPYLDDTMLHSVDPWQHLKVLQDTLEAHRKAGLTLQADKCRIMQEEVEYLGHLVSAKGVRPQTEYTRIVEEWPLPTSVTQLRGFLGKVSYYRRFIKDFGALAQPLQVMLENKAGAGQGPAPKTQVVTWDAHSTACFEALKQALVQAPILAHPDFECGGKFIVDTDWSEEHRVIGGVLSQVQDGEERVIAYGAKKLNKSQSNYSSNKGELAALLYFLSLWEYYLQPGKFMVRTDHQALSWLKTMKQPPGMESRWLELLAGYDFEIQHRKGVLHGNADALSRRDDVHDEIELDPREPRADYVCALANDAGVQVDWTVEQAKDDDLCKIMKWHSEDDWPSRNGLQAESPAVSSYAAWREKLEVKEGVLYLRDPRPHGCLPKICVPEHLQEDVLSRAHELGHQGVGTTVDRVRKRFYFPNMARKTAEAISRCGECLQKRRSITGQKQFHAPIYAGAPFQRLSIDHVGPIPRSTEGNRYLLTCKDFFTRWVEAFPVPDLTAATAAKVLEKEIFARYGLPEAIHADNGTSFTSRLMHDVYKELNISYTHTPPYNPKSNVVERSHGDLGRMLRALNTQGPEHWEKFLPAALLAMRTAKCRTTGYSPFFLMFGREATLPLDLVYGAPQSNTKDSEGFERHEWGRKLRSRLEGAYSYARDHLQVEVRRQRRQYQQKSPRGQVHLGDQVWLFTPRAQAGGGRKLSRYWTGPYEVAEVISPVVFRIRSVGEWNQTQLEIVVGLDRLVKMGSRNHLIEPVQETGLDLQASDLRWLEGEVAAELPEAHQEQDVAAGQSSRSANNVDPEAKMEASKARPAATAFPEETDDRVDGEQEEVISLSEEEQETTSLGEEPVLEEAGSPPASSSESEDEEEVYVPPKGVKIPKGAGQSRQPPRRSQRLKEKNLPPLRRSQRLREKLQKQSAELQLYSLQAVLKELLQEPWPLLQHGLPALDISPSLGHHDAPAVAHLLAVDRQGRAGARPAEGLRLFQPHQPGLVRGGHRRLVRRRDPQCGGEGVREQAGHGGPLAADGGCGPAGARVLAHDVAVCGSLWHVASLIAHPAADVEGSTCKDKCCGLPQNDKSKTI